MLFFKEPSFDQLPKSASPGDLLTGHVTFLKRPSGQIGSSSEPGKGFPVQYSVADTKPPAAAPSTVATTPESEGADTDSTDSKKKLEDSLTIAVRDAKVKLLSDLSTPAEFDPLAEALVAEYPDHIPLRVIVLNRAVQTASKSVPTSGPVPPSDSESFSTSTLAWRKVVEVCDNLIELIDLADLAREFGVNLDKSDRAQVAARKEADAKKTALITALSSMASAAIALSAEVSTGTEAGGGEGIVSRTINSEGSTLLEATLKQLQKWDDIKAEKHWQLALKRHKGLNLWGLVLKRVNELLDSSTEGGGKKGSKDSGAGSTASRDKLIAEQAACLETLGPDWAHIASELAAWNRFLQRPGYEPF